MVIHMEKWVNKNKYWFAITTALNYGGSLACLDILHDDSISKSLPRHPKSLFIKLSNQRPFLYNLLKHGILTLREYELMLNPREEADSKNFDLGLIIALLQGLVLPEPKNGWLDPDPEDMSLSAMLVELRRFKDKINKIKATQTMESDVFNVLWDELNEILHSLYFDTTLINEIYLVTKRDKFHFKREFVEKYDKAYNKSKHIYLIKVLEEIRQLFEQHVENVDTVTTVVKRQKVSKIYKDIIRIKKALGNMYHLYEQLIYSKYQDASKLLNACARTTLSIELNDECLEKIIQGYNHKLNKREEIDEENLSNKRSVGTLKKYFTLRKTAVVGWLRRNTIVYPPTLEQFENEEKGIKNKQESNNLDTEQQITDIQNGQQITSSRNEQQITDIKNKEITNIQNELQIADDQIAQQMTDIQNEQQISDVQTEPGIINEPYKENANSANANLTNNFIQEINDSEARSNFQFYTDDQVVEKENSLFGMQTRRDMTRSFFDRTHSMFYSENRQDVNRGIVENTHSMDDLLF